MKEDVKKLKDEKTKLDKKTKQLAKKVKSDKLENETDSNQNIPPEFSSRSCSSVLSSSRTQASSTPTLGPCPRPPTSTSPPTTPARAPSDCSTPQCSTGTRQPKPPPRSCSPHTPHGEPPPPSTALSTGTSQHRTADPTSTTPSAFTNTMPITEEYIAGINQIDLGPRVNDLSQF